MIKRIGYLLSGIFCIALVGCSYDLKYIKLDESADTQWTEVRKANTLGRAEESISNSGAKLDISENAKKLRELKKLREEGLLTEQEYEKKRKAIVEGI